MLFTVPLHVPLLYLIRSVSQREKSNHGDRRRHSILISESQTTLYDLGFRQVVTLLSLFRTSPETSTASGEALAHRVPTLKVPQMKSTRGTPMKFSVEILGDGTAHLYLPIRKPPIVQWHRGYFLRGLVGNTLFHRKGTTLHPTPSYLAQIPRPWSLIFLNWFFLKARNPAPRDVDVG